MPIKHLASDEGVATPLLLRAGGAVFGGARFIIGSFFRVRSPSEAAMSLTRRSLAEKISVRQGLSLREARNLVDLMFEEISQAIAAEERVKLSGFGTFSVHESPKSIGRRPSTEDEPAVVSRKRLRFKPSPVLIDRVNNRT